MGKQLKSHQASFKFKVVLESFTSNTVAETARKYGIHPNQLSTWRSYFQEQEPSIFQTDASKRERG
jgi:transposase